MSVSDQELNELAKRLRSHSLRMISKAKTSHIGSCLSAADILAVLYGRVMRVDPKQPWHPVYLLQPVYNVLLMLFFEWGVAVHDLDFEAIRKARSQRASCAMS